jgi:predicted SAM-dependent methyltransferase
LTQTLPISSNSIKYIYASHFIEHLDFSEGITFLKQCYSMMMKGAIIRLTCPDLELWIKKYYENDISFFNNYKSFFSIGIHPLVKTKGNIFMSQVHNWGHKWNYDFDSMRHLLQVVGFQKISKKSYHDSMIPEIRTIEPYDEGRKLETLYVEAQKR